MPEGPDQTDRLLGRTRRRLVLVTFGLIAALVIGVGTVTGVIGLALLDVDVDRALQNAVEAAARVPVESSGETGEADEVIPAAADTFVLYLDGTGALVSNPSRVRLDSLPDASAVAAVAAGARSDWRTVVSGGVSVRLLTLPVPNNGESLARYVQGGFVQTLHDRESQSLVLAIAGTGLVGLLAAAIVAGILTRRALQPIRRAMDGQRQFVADASHELRTPAAIIHADAEILEREGHVGPDGLPLVRDIVEESARVGRLVGDLLTLATAERGELQLVRERVDLADLGLETARRMAPLAAARGIAIRATSDGLCTVAGDRDRLVQVIVVLLDNAIGHAPSGSEIELAVRREAKRASLAVVDHGPGVPAADRERIFEPFRRSVGGRAERRRGAGLGLAIAKAIVVAHGGHIEVDDAPRGGARFVVSLPASG
jgi:two-component system, OmpR family, sensor histidine kinase CiaH